MVFFHAKEGRHINALYAHIPKPFSLLFSHGALGVQIFFVLSGFVIAHSMARQDVGTSFVARFLLRRSIRLDPPYWASMLLVVALAMLSVHFVPGKVYTPPNAADVLAHVLYLPVLLQRPLISDVYWTLCLEIQFYLVFACAMLLITSLRARLGDQRAFMGVLVGMCLVSLPWALGIPLFVVPGLFIEYWHFFLAGVVAWRTSYYRDERFALGLAAVYLSVLLALSFVLADPARGVAAVTAGTIVIVGRLDKLTVWLKAEPLQRLGAASYSLYLTHNPLTGAFLRVGYKLTGRTVLLEAVWLVLIVVACILIAWIFHVAIERPSLKLSHRIRLKSQPVTH